MMQITQLRQFLTCLFLIIILGAGILWGASRLIWGPPTLLKSGDFAIEGGQAASSVWKKLASEEFTKRTLPWKYHAWRQGVAASLQAGTYRLEQGEKIGGVVQRFATGDVTPDELTITYPEGFTLEQIAERTAARGIGTKEEFLTAAKPENFAEQFPFLKDLPANRSLEGYLFPDTYRVFPDDRPHDVIKRMLTNFDAKITEDIRTAAAAQNRSLDQVIRMASIVEREVLTDEDMAVAAGILWKRADEGAGLDADATVRYALKKWDGRLTVQDLQIDSPYNTRRYRGLPPGPISNPGLRAILASAKPQPSDFYYYLSTPEGKTIFSKTNDEHNANKAKYLR